MIVCVLQISQSQTNSPFLAPFHVWVLFLFFFFDYSSLKLAAVETLSK